MDLLRPCMLFNNERINKVWLKTQYRAERFAKKGEATMKGRKFIKDISSPKKLLELDQLILLDFLQFFGGIYMFLLNTRV